MAVANGGYEEEGAAPGLASGWTATFVSSAEEFADIALNPSDGYTAAAESFERGWTGLVDQELLGAFQGPTMDLELAIFSVGPGQQQHDSFERNWSIIGPVQFLPHLSGLEEAVFAGAGAHEGFELGWGDVLLELESGDLEEASFNPLARASLFESFESDWGEYFFEFDDPQLEVLQFEEGHFARNYESFEAVRTRQAITVDVTTDEFTSLADLGAPTTLLNGHRITFENDEGDLPTPLTKNTTYYATLVSLGHPSTFKVSGQSTQLPVVNISGAGSGYLYFRRDPVFFWTIIMRTV